jgi:hypothetical protein
MEKEVKKIIAGIALGYLSDSQEDKITKSILTLISKRERIAYQEGIITAHKHNMLMARNCMEAKHMNKVYLVLNSMAFGFCFGTGMMAYARGINGTIFILLGLANLPSVVYLLHWKD